jgi:hypothetical protein
MVEDELAWLLLRRLGVGIDSFDYGGGSRGEPPLHFCAIGGGGAALVDRVGPYCAKRKLCPALSVSTTSTPLVPTPLLRVLSRL